MRKSYKFKIYNNKRKNKKLNLLIDNAAVVWNYSIAKCKQHYFETGKHFSRAKLQSHLVVVKKETNDLPVLRELNSQLVQQITDRIDYAYSRFFNWVKTKEGPRMLPPKFKPIRKYKSVTFKQTAWKYTSGNSIKINKVSYKFHRSREILGTIKTVTVKRDSLGDFWLILSCDNVPSPKPLQKTGNAVGIDFGLKMFLTLSDEKSIKSLEPLKRSLKKIAKLQRKVNRRNKKSKRRKKAQLNLARQHRKIRNQRNEFHWKTALDIIKNYDEIAIEDLDLQGMKSRWGRKVSDLGFGSFVLKLEYLSKKYEKEVIKIDRYYPSSQTCSACGWRHPDFGLGDNPFPCCSCGLVIDRDLNASINILGRAWSYKNNDDCKTGNCISLSS